MDACFDPDIPTKVVTKRSTRFFIFLLVFWFVGFLIPFIFPPRSFVKMNALERIKFPEKIKYKFNSHLTSKEIFGYLKRYIAVFKHKAKIFALKPKTYQGRDIYMVHIKLPQTYGNVIKGRILVLGGMIGYLWDSVMTTIDLIHKLCEDCRYKYPYTMDYEWFIIPIFNPDGYDYTLSIRNTAKNPAEIGNPKNRAYREQCADKNSGVSLDRNFGFHWGESKGIDYDICYQWFAGEFPFSENETIAMKTFIEFQYKNKSAPITMYIQVHGNGRRDDITYPWRYTARKPFNYKILDNMAEVAARAVRTEMGYWFTHEQSGIRDLGSGLMTDWLRGTHNVPYLFTIEPWFKVSNETDLPNPRMYMEKAICIIFSLVKSLNNIEALSDHQHL